MELSGVVPQLRPSFIIEKRRFFPIKGGNARFNDFIRAKKEILGAKNQTKRVAGPRVPSYFANGPSR